MNTGNLVLLKIVNRERAAEKVQHLLTIHGCVIQARIGFHETSDNECARSGMIILQLSPGSRADELKRALTEIEGVLVGKVVF